MDRARGTYIVIDVGGGVRAETRTPNGTFLTVINAPAAAAPVNNKITDFLASYVPILTSYFAVPAASCQKFSPLARYLAVPAFRRLAISRRLSIYIYLYL